MFSTFQKYTTQFTLGLCTLSLLTFSSCDKDDDIETPTVQEITSFDYSFENASYTGQLERLALLEDLSAKGKSASGTGITVTKAELQTLFEKSSENGKKLNNKTDDGAVSIIEDWFADLDTASQSTDEAKKGIAGRLPKGETAYLFDKNGFEPAQLIEKGLMGACFYFQATGIDGYLSATTTEKGLLVDNSVNEEGKTYTSLEHHWDEAFGYFGAPTTLTSLTTDGAKFHAKYSLKGEAGSLNITNDIMKAFYLGRKAIVDKDLDEAKAQAIIIKEKWELTNVAAAIHYLNTAGGDDFSSDVARMHELSEAYAFIWSLNFNENKKISSTQVNEVLALLGDNFWDITKTDIENTAKKLAEIYGLDDTTRQVL